MHSSLLQNFWLGIQGCSFSKSLIIGVSVNHCLNILKLSLASMPKSYGYSHSAIHRNCLLTNCTKETVLFTKNCGLAEKQQFSSAIMELGRNISTIPSSSVFRLNDYDCVGFDLDNTICEYNVSAMTKMEYETLAQFMVQEKGYDGKHLLRPLKEFEIDFFQKGLLLDFARGNVLRISNEGEILRASHGTKFMSDGEIVEVYGAAKKWEVSTEFSNDLLIAWNGPLAENMRTLLDYFDMPAVLVFARTIDTLDDKTGNPSNCYTVWPDVLQGLVNMYNREHFSTEKGGYFPKLKADPHKYIKKCDDKVLEWLRQIKEAKKVFLITGSNVDFASFTARHSIGENWKSYFDIIICYARKPGFFIGGRPFIQLNEIQELDPISGSELEFGNIYSQGNWQELYQLLARKLNKNHPKCVYIGDNLIQDIYTPHEYTKCDTVAVVEELAAEGMAGVADYKQHPHSSILQSNAWGSYFGHNNGVHTLWGGIIKKYSKLCIPSLRVLADKGLDFELNTFTTNKSELVSNSQVSNNLAGYYPGWPTSL